MCTIRICTNGLDSRPSIVSDNTLQDKWDLEKLKAFYGQNQLQTDKISPINKLLLEHVEKLKPKTIFEFGCNQGKNLKWLEEHGFDKVYGIDIANIYHPKTVWGDEKTLETFGSKSVELTFTCSVLNHIPFDTVKEIIIQLKRMSHHVILGEIMHELDNPRWFKHDYTSLGFDLIGTALQAPNDKIYGLYTFFS